MVGFSVIGNSKVSFQYTQIGDSVFAFDDILDAANIAFFSSN